MSLVGTRPPTVDEWEKYELHHRSRMSTKPGITGMWQVSGRSDITDFEEVVRLDTEYMDATVTIATSKSQVSAIHNQLGENVGISVEPCRRDTFPAIALAAAYLKDVQGVGEEESVVVCPVDPYVEDDYFEALKALGERAQKSDSNLVLMGIEPTYPSEKYGYIIPLGKEAVSRVSMFKEKPTQEVAKEYIEKGALWNGGVFAFRLGYVLERAHELIDFLDYDDLFCKYEMLKKISFDYAVVEHEPEIEVMRFAGTWKDLGTWNTLTEAMDSQCVGQGVLNDTCENVHVVNELNVPILCVHHRHPLSQIHPFQTDLALLHKHHPALFLQSSDDRR